jgi:hypothetical protein
MNTIRIVTDIDMVPAHFRYNAEDVKRGVKLARGSISSRRARTVSSIILLTKKENCIQFKTDQAVV